MTNEDKEILRIRAFIRENKFSNLEFSKRTGVLESTIRRLFKPNPDPRLSTIRKLQSAIPDSFDTPAPSD